LQASTVKGIASLVAGSVEQLRPESVTILDTFGRFLSSPTSETEASPLAGLQLDKQQALEHDLSTKVQTLLEPVVGAGHVRVNVPAVLNAAALDETEEKWDPQSVVRSKATSSDTNSMLNPLGTAGARANQPAGASTSTNQTPPAGSTPATPPPNGNAPA